MLIPTDNRSEILRLDQRTGSGKSTESDAQADPAKTKGTKGKKQGTLFRSKSIKGDEGSRNKLNKAPSAQLSPDPGATWTTNGEATPLKNAPTDKGKTWSNKSSFGKLRTHSADRHDTSQLAHREHDNGTAGPRRDKSEQGSLQSSSYNDNRGASLMSSLGFGARKMGDKMDSARKGIFGKLGRSHSNHESPTHVSNEPYVYKVIHTPLVEQTRLTRISSRLEQSRDKTEFWMPALPWRCIDYLNMRGCEEEGLYRVPGSAQQVRYYERKFDQGECEDSCVKTMRLQCIDRDIDLISDDNLNDPNVIGSLFKNWLRQLPDEIFPKAIQHRIQQECQGAKTTPQMLKDELSKLPPFNYYLLFAITCHISLLHSCSEFNKMNYNNLCICFQPAIKIDAFCFQFLILDWRNCWQGCWTEKEYLAEELDYLRTLESESSSSERQQATASRNGHSQPSGRSKSSHASPNIPQPRKSTSTRSNSGDQSKSSARAQSADRNGRATPPVLPPRDPEMPPQSAPRLRSEHREYDSLAERAISTSDGLNIRGPPSRPAPSVSTRDSVDGDEGAAPAQALHSRGPSDTQFRLDLSNPPSSPFNIKF